MAGLKICLQDAVLLNVTVCGMHGFLLEDDKCRPSYTCSCTNITSCLVGCFGYASMPTLLEPNLTCCDVYTHLTYNEIKIIPEDAFTILVTPSSTDVHLKLLHSGIAEFDSGAFAGTENLTYHIDLQYNNLSTLPLAFGQLQNLSDLDLRHNPMQSMDAHTMASIGQSLQKLSLTLDYFRKWPKEIHFLRSLVSLTLEDIMFTHLDPDAFIGLQSLTSLTIEHSKLQQVPEAICDLKVLEELYFTHNHNLSTTQYLFKPCSTPFPSVYYLNLICSDLQDFPDVYNLFPFLKYLYLSHNRLIGIPRAVKTLASLELLGLRKNNITFIDDLDLAGLANLQKLFLSRDPLTNISSRAFDGTLALTFLDLKSTQLGFIPQAVMALSNLMYLDIRFVRSINCTCDMKYLNPLNMTSMSGLYTDKCAGTSGSIKHYIMNDLQHCQ